MKQNRFFQYVQLIFFLFLLVLSAGCSGAATPALASPPPGLAAATNTAAPPRATSTRSAPTLTASPAPSPMPSATLSPHQWFQAMSRDWRVAYYDKQEIQICAMYVDGRNKLCLDFYGGDFGYSYPSTNFLSWSPDGSRLAIATECNIFIWKVGGEVTPLRADQTCGFFRDLAWSPAGDYIVYVSLELERVAPRGVYYADVFVDSLDGSIHRALTAGFNGGGSPAWSPDGQSLAFSTGGAISVLSWEGGAASNLTQLPTGGGYPFWSPDGRSIAYFRGRDDAWTIFSQPVGGGEERKLAEIPIADQSDRRKRYPVAWLPGGNYILYNDRLIDTRTGEITSLQLGFDTTYAAWYTPAETAKAIPLPVPTLSPPTATPGRPTGRTGGKIAYTSCSSDAPESCEIFVMNADGSEPTQITHNHAYDGSPDWSPDGQRLVFVSNRGSLDEIYVMDADGGNLIRLTDNTAAHSPAWSPDGRQIVFVSYREQANVNLGKVFLASLTYGTGPPIEEIYVMNVDGSNQTRLTNNEASERMPVWSPDGKKIAFVSNRDFEEEIYMMNADGSNLTRFSTIWGRIEGWAWSPDGVQMSSPKIAFGLNNSIHVWKGNGLETFPTNMITLTIRPVVASSPDWSPDGKEIVYVNERHGSAQIYVMNADGSNQIALTGDNSRKYSPAWSTAAHSTAAPIPITAHLDCTSGWTRLEAGGMAKVSEENTTPNRVRSGPSTADEIIAQLPPGTVVRLIEGPICAGGLVSWKVESNLIPGGVGWTAEGDGKEYYLVPYNP